MYVDQSLQLWGFFDVYGSTQSVRVLSRSQDTPVYQQLPINVPHIVPTNKCIAGAQTPIQETIIARQSNAPIRNIPGSMPSNLQVQSSGTVLVVNLPTARSQQNISRLSNSRMPLPGTSIGSAEEGQSRVPIYSSSLANFNNYNDNAHTPGIDCTICYENPIDSVSSFK